MFCSSYKNLTLLFICAFFVCGPTHANSLKAYAFNPQAPFITDALVISVKGDIVFESYANGWNKLKKHRMWSCAKSLSALLFGMAEYHKKIHREELLSKYFPKTNSASKYYQQIKLSHLLHMSSGLQWSEGYEHNPLGSDVLQMLYLKGHANMPRYVLNKPAQHRPGTVFNYSSGETNLLLAALNQALQGQLYNFAQHQLFRPLGIKDWTWEADASGHMVGSSYLYLKAQDAIKIGQLMLNKGVWNGKRLFSEGYFEFLKTPAPAVEQTDLGESFNQASYGAHWWLNVPLEKNKDLRNYPAAGADLIYASGHHGQLLLVYPAQEMVVVRFGRDKGERLDINELSKRLMVAIESGVWK